MKKLFFLCVAVFMVCGAYAESEGERLFNENHPDKAAPILEKEIAEGRVEANTFNILGLSYFQLGDYARAMDAFERGMKNPISNRRQIAFNEGNVAYMKGDYIKAENCFSLAIAARPDFSQAILNRANTRIMTQKFKDAELDYRRFLELEPDDEQADNIRLLLSYLADELRKKEEEEARIAQAKRQTEEENRRIEEALMKIAAGYGAASAVRDAAGAHSQGGLNGADGQGTGSDAHTGTAQTQDSTNGSMANRTVQGMQNGQNSDDGKNTSDMKAASSQNAQNPRTEDASAKSMGSGQHRAQTTQTGQNIAKSEAAGSADETANSSNAKQEGGNNLRTKQQTQAEAANTKSERGGSGENNAARSAAVHQMQVEKSSAARTGQVGTITQTNSPKNNGSTEPGMQENALTAVQENRANSVDGKNTSDTKDKLSQNAQNPRTADTSAKATGTGRGSNEKNSGTASAGSVHNLQKSGAAETHNADDGQKRASQNTGTGREQIKDKLSIAGENGGKENKTAQSPQTKRQAAASTDKQIEKKHIADGTQQSSNAANGRAASGNSRQQTEDVSSKAAIHEAQRRKFREDVVRSLKRGDTTNMSAGAEEIFDYEYEPELD